MARKTRSQKSRSRARKTRRSGGAQMKKMSRVSQSRRMREHKRAAMRKQKTRRNNAMHNYVAKEQGRLENLHLATYPGY